MRLFLDENLSPHQAAAATDHGSSIRNNAGESPLAIDNYNLRREHSLSQLHNGHRFVSSLLYELPSGNRKR